MASNSTTTNKMIEYPFALEWTIAEDRLKTLKFSTNGDFLKTDKFTVVHASEVQYFLKIYPNGWNDDGCLGKTWISLHLNFGNEKTIEAEGTYSIESANWKNKMNIVFEKSQGRGTFCCTVAELFDLNKKFIFNGKFVLKVKGIFKIKTAESKQELEHLQSKHFPNMWKIGFEDFTIVADQKEIMVHKNILAAQSPVFKAMFTTKMKESTENRVEIPDFSFEIIEMAIKMCYNQNPDSDLSIEKAFLIMQFADKYDLEILKEKMELYLGGQLTVTNVCEIANRAINENASKLKNKCLDFILIFFREKPVPKMELLDKDFLLTVLNNFACRESATL